MSIREARLIISLIDRVTGPARGIAAQLKGLNSAIERNDARLAATRGQMLDAVGAAYALAKAITAPTQAFAEFETTLEDIAQKINKPRTELPKLGADIRAVARETTNLSANIAKGFDVLVGKGASESDALAMLRPIGKAAVAYRADIDDLGKAGYAALSNLKVPADQFGRSLDVMAESSKAGAFELKDMAKYFPTLGAAYQGLKQTGLPAVADLSAALQIVQRGAGDASTAATNLGNVIQKIYAPATERAFKKMGVNLRKEMAKSLKAGMTPIEAIADLTNRVLKGDLSKLGMLFEDAQVQAGLRPLIQDMEDYKKIRADALAAQGVVEADYLDRLRTGAIAGQRFAVAMERINLAVGAALMPALTDLANTLVPILDNLAKLAEENPGLTKAIVATAAAVVGLNVAMIGIKFAGLFAFGGILKLAKGGLLAATGISKLGGMLGALVGLGKSAKAVLPASLDGFSRASQGAARNARAATDASRRMVEGMGAARQASDRMISGMSAAASKASVAGFTSFGERAGKAATTALRAAFQFGIATMIAEMVADLERELEERFPLLKKFNRAIPNPVQIGKLGHDWVANKLFGNGIPETPPPPSNPLQLTVRPPAAAKPIPLPTRNPLRGMTPLPLPNPLRSAEIIPMPDFAGGARAVEQAGTSAGTDIGQGGTDAATAIRGAANDLRQAGKDAAQAISSARIQGPGQMLRSGPNANLGQSMPDAGITGR